MVRSARLCSVSKIGALGAVLLLGASARAADLDLTAARRAPPPTPVATSSPWAGFYAGALYGAGYASVRSSRATSRTAAAWGQTSGALIGYLFQSGSLVYGPEGGIDFHLLRPENGGAPGLAASVNDTLETFRLRARVGYNLGSFLPFVAAGLAASKAYEMNYPWPLDEYGQSRWETGVSLGAGLEWRFVAPVLGPIAVRGEYIYDAYPTETFALQGGPMRARAGEQFFRVGLISYPDGNWRPPASSATAVDWSGAYGGVLLGGLWARPHTSLAGASTTYDASGGVAGLLTGQNFTFGPWVVGYEGAVLATERLRNRPPAYYPDGPFHELPQLLRSRRAPARRVRLRSVPALRDGGLGLGAQRAIRSGGRLLSRPRPQ